jgi:hypothetical protein
MVNVPPCPRHARIAIRRIRELAEQRAIRITRKAQEEMAALDPAADIDDVLEVLVALAPEDWVCRLISHVTSEALHVFKPMTPFGLLYVKVIVRKDCIVVSFHEELEE